MRLRASTAGLLLTTLLTALWLSACALTPARPRRVATEEEQQALDGARSELARRPELGVVALETFLRRFPESSLADDAAESLAAFALAGGDDDEAVRWLSYIVQLYGQEDRSDAARLQLARIFKQRSDFVGVRRALERVRFSRLDTAARWEAWRLLTEISEDPVDKLRWLAPLRAAAAEQRDELELREVDREIDALLDPMSAADLLRAADQLDPRIPAARVRLRLAERAIDAGDFEAAERQQARASKLPHAPAYHDSFLQLELRLELRERIESDSEGLPTFADVAALPQPSTKGARGTLGVVLPLTGPLADYGEQSLRGIQLAAEIFDETGGALASGSEIDARGGGVLAETSDRFAGGRLRLLVRDTGGQPELAAEAVRELSARDDVVAIIGPLLSAPSEAAAEVAQEFGVPLIALTSKQEVPRKRPYVFRIRTTPSDEVQHLVDRAVLEAGATRFAILYPADNYGRGMRERFWQAVEARGAFVVAASSYDPDATDFATPIRRMIGYTLLTRAEKSALSERSQLLRRARRLAPEQAALARQVAFDLLGPEGERLPPIVDFDALFIPDSYEKIILVAPQLAFHDITDVQLLGPGAWLHPDLVRIARKHVQGAMISAPFHPESRFVFVSRFVERYTTVFEETPDVFAAHAFDAANLVLVQLANGRDSRKRVRDGLLRVRGYPGVSGVTRILPDGNARKRPYLLGVRGRSIISLD